MSAVQEKRRHARAPLDHAALLEHADWGPRACRLRDVSAGGALLVNDGSGLEADRCSPGDLIQMRFSAASGLREGYDTHVVTGRVVRVLRSALGISFVDATARALSVLRRLVDVHRHKGTQRPDPDALLSTAADLLADFQRESGRMLLRRLDTSLMEAARAAGNDRDARVLFDARRSLESHRGDFLDHLEHELARQMAHRTGAGVATPVATSGHDADMSLELVDLAVLEESLFAQHCLERAERRDPGLFHRYRRGVAALPPPPAGMRDPLDPESIVARFAEAARTLGLDPVVRPMVAAAFDEALNAPLRRVLGQLIEALPTTREPAIPHAPRPRNPSTRRPPAPLNPGRASDFGDHGPLDSFTRSADVTETGSGPASFGSMSSPAAGGAGLERLSAGRPGGSGAGADGERDPTVEVAGVRPGALLNPDDALTAAAWPWAASGPAKERNRFLPGDVPLSGTLSGSLPHFDFPSPPGITPASLATRLLARQPGAARLTARQAQASDWGRWVSAFAEWIPAESHGLPAEQRSMGLFQQLRVERADLVADPPVGELHEALQLADAHWVALAGDPGVHPDVLASLSRMRAWLHAWGLREPGWMLKEASPLAALLDRLAALWPQSGAEAGVVELVEAVCLRLLDDAEQAFADLSLLETLDDALQVQRLRASDRIDRLIRDNDEAWANTLARRRHNGEPAPRLDATASPLRHWLQLARDWRRGEHAILQRGKRRLPVELVWVDEEATAWVFADPSGQDVAAMTRQELAVNLRRGTLCRRASATEPLSLRLRRVLLERLAGGATRPPSPLPTPAGDDLPLRLGADEVAGSALADRTLRFGPGGADGVPVVWREADGRILSSTVVSLSGPAKASAATVETQAEQFIEVVAVGSGDVSTPLRLPELATAFDDAGVRQRLDLLLWDAALTTAEANGSRVGHWAVRIAAATLLSAEGFEAFQARLLDASISPRRFTVVVDAGMSAGDEPPEGLTEVLHALDALGLRLAADVSRGSLTGWRNLPITRLWMRTPASGATRSERDRVASLADFARWTDWPLVAIVDARSLPAADLAALGVTHLAAPREWRPLPTLQ